MTSVLQNVLYYFFNFNTNRLILSVFVTVFVVYSHTLFFKAALFNSTHVPKAIEQIFGFVKLLVSMRKCKYLKVATVPLKCKFPKF